MPHEINNFFSRSLCIDRCAIGNVAGRCSFGAELASHLNLYTLDSDPALAGLAI